MACSRVYDPLYVVLMYIAAVFSARLQIRRMKEIENQPETLLQSYSIVFQDVVLFRDTIMENIRLGSGMRPMKK